MGVRTRGTSPSGIAIATEYVPAKWAPTTDEANWGGNNYVHIVPISRLIERVTVDRLRIQIGAVAAGSIILGIYGPGTGPFLPDGATLLAQTASFFAVNVALNEAVLTVPAVGYLQLSAPYNYIGVPYWFAAVCDNVVCIPRGAGTTGGGSRVSIRTYAAGALTLTNPCPVTFAPLRGIYMEAGVLRIP